MLHLCGTPLEPGQKLRTSISLNMSACASIMKIVLSRSMSRFYAGRSRETVSKAKKPEHRRQQLGGESEAPARPPDHLPPPPRFHSQMVHSCRVLKATGWRSQSPGASGKATTVKFGVRRSKTILLWHPVKLSKVPSVDPLCCAFDIAARAARPRVRQSTSPHPHPTQLSEKPAKLPGTTQPLRNRTAMQVAHKPDK